MIHKDAGDKQENGSEGKQWPGRPENYSSCDDGSEMGLGFHQLTWRIENPCLFGKHFSEISTGYPL